MPRRHTRRISGKADGVQGKSGAAVGTAEIYRQLMEGRQEVMACVMAMGLEGIGQVLEYARSRLCGEPYERDEQKHLARWGYKAGRAYVGGQQVRLNRPRVRDVRAGREVGIEAWEKLQDPLEFDEAVFERVVRGISTRDYEGALGTTMEALGVSRSGVDRAFIREATRRLLLGQFFLQAWFAALSGSTGSLFRPIL